MREKDEADKEKLRRKAQQLANESARLREANALKEQRVRAKRRINPFAFRFVHQCATREELDEIRGPKVVFASTNTLDHGFAHDLFGEWARNPKNLVILTDRVCPVGNATFLTPTHADIDQTSRISTRGGQMIVLSGINFGTKGDLQGVSLGSVSGEQVSLPIYEAPGLPKEIHVSNRRD